MLNAPHLVKIDFNHKNIRVGETCILYTGVDAWLFLREEYSFSYYSLRGRHDLPTIDKILDMDKENFNRGHNLDSFDGYKNDGYELYKVIRSKFYLDI